MKELLNKISSYNLFNYLFPGVLYVVIIDKITDLNFLQENIIVGAFLYYFIGMVISRIGSLIIEPLLTKLKYIKYAEYSSYIKASKNDTKIELLSESNNTYRTLVSLFVSILFTKFFLFISSEYEWISDIGYYIILSGLLLLFLFSYRKQTNFIRKRIDSQMKEQSKIIS